MLLPFGRAAANKVLRAQLARSSVHKKLMEHWIAAKAHSNANWRALGRTAWVGLLSATLAASVGCFKAAQAPVTSAVSITLSPSTTSVGPGQPVVVTANVYDVSGKGATWTASPLDFGSFSHQSTTSITYTAPTSFTVGRTITITATSIEDPTVASSVQISVVPISVSISALVGTVFVSSAQTVNQGGQLFLTGNVVNDVTSSGVTWTLSPASGAGSLAGPPPDQNCTVQACQTYVAPSSVSAPTTAMVTATSTANSEALANIEITVLPSGGGGNVALATVDGGPVPGQVQPNAAYTSVTVCQHGSTTACQTINGILIDTGSSGVRILQSAIPLLKLPGFVDTNGNTLENCFPLPDGSYLWGPVSLADIYIGGEIATTVQGSNGVPIQIIKPVNQIVPNGCSNGGTNLNTPQLLGANGILGVGPEPTDCTIGGKNLCDGTEPAAPPNLYYSCLSSGCLTTDSPVIATDTQQIANPVPWFGAFSRSGPDDNGVILDLPAATGNEASLQGRLIFGIGTEPDSTIFDSADNSLGTAAIFTMNENDQFTTVWNGQNFNSSYIDSGINAILFPASLPVCTDYSQFFCPSVLTNFSAVNEGATQGTSPVNFGVGNAKNLLSSNPNDAVFDTLAGPRASSSCGKSGCDFVWGLPFFYGRRVYTAIAGQTVQGAPASPWWAY
jgi:hypothetical protein